MSATLALAGWGMAAAGWAAAAVVRRRLLHDHEAVARASHELRGPLTAVRLGLESRRLAPNRLTAIDLELGQAALALDDLSGMSDRRRRGEPRGRDEQFDLAELLVQSVEAWRPAARAVGASLRFGGLRDDAHVNADRLRLAQAVGNLIANAIEHGGGAIVVELSRSADRLRVEIADDGPGLPVRVAQRSLVEKRGAWTSLSSRLGRQRPGIRGHGLAIATAIATAHGGSLSTSPSERGARLILELPAGTAGPGTNAETP